jgi:hypothetical protein
MLTGPPSISMLLLDRTGESWRQDPRGSPAHAVAQEVSARDRPDAPI